MFSDKENKNKNKNNETNKNETSFGSPKTFFPAALNFGFGILNFVMSQNYAKEKLSKLWLVMAKVLIKFIFAIKLYLITIFPLYSCPSNQGWLIFSKTSYHICVYVFADSSKKINTNQVFFKLHFYQVLCITGYCGVTMAKPNKEIIHLTSWFSS